MPSSRYTKINIDIEILDFLQTLAAAQGISATQMNERIILFYLSHQHGNKS